MTVKNLSKKILVILGSIAILIMFMRYVFYSFSKDTISNTGLDINNTKYDATEKMDLAFTKLKNQRQEALEIKGINTKEKIVAITFDDLADYGTMKKIQELLESYSAKATFFVPGIRAAENPEIIEHIITKKQEIGNYTLSALRNMEDMDEKELVEDFCLSGDIIEKIAGEMPRILKCNETQYTKTLLEIANACGIDSVVSSTHIFNYQSFASYEDTLGYIRKIKPGDIVSIKVRGYLGPDEYKATRKEEKLERKKEPAITKIDKDDELLSEEERLLQVIKWILDALKELEYRTEFVKDLSKFTKHHGDYIKDSVADNKVIYTTESVYKNLQNKNNTISKIIINNQEIDTSPSQYDKLRRKNNGKKSKIINNLYTAQPAVSYIFRGIENKSTVYKILDILDSIDAKATFFVTGKEIISYPDTLSAIISRGHSLGNGGYGENINNPSSLEYDEISYEIEMGERILKAFLGEKNNSFNKYYMPLYGDTNGCVLEAASALGYKDIIMYNRNPVLGRYKDLDSNTIMETYYKNTLSLHRGDIVYFRLNYLTQLEAIEEIVLKTAEKLIKVSNYDIVSIDELMTSPLVYIPKSKEYEIVDSYIKPSYDYDEATLANFIFNNYIGTPSISTTETLIGFSSEEIDNIDSTGTIDTHGEKVIFLTFDDWGSDIIINKLLSVLNKHNVKASFFVRVGNDKIPYEKGMLNPNLLRAIALQGHDIGSHTFSHMKIDITTEEEKLQLQKDLVVAYEEMERYIGDLEALKPFFRPPTLAVSKLGIQTAFDTGHKYIINGDFSIQDYKAPSLEFLVETLKNGINIIDRDSNVTKDTPDEYIRKIQPGSIIIMHMSDEAKYTPDALDIIIPYYIDQGYRFDKLSNYLSIDGKDTP